MLLYCTKLISLCKKYVIKEYLRINIILKVYKVIKVFFFNYSSFNYFITYSQYKTISITL